MAVYGSTIEPVLGQATEILNHNGYRLVLEPEFAEEIPLPEGRYGTPRRRAKVELRFSLFEDGSETPIKIVTSWVQDGASFRGSFLRADGVPVPYDLRMETSVRFGPAS